MYNSLQNNAIQETVVQASVGHRSFGQLLRKAHNEEQRTIIEHDGFPVAVLLPYQTYQAMKNKLAVQALDDLHTRVSAEPLAQLLTEETLIQEVRQQRQQSFTSRYAKSS